jgi:hypothetical protein
MKPRILPISFFDNSIRPSSDGLKHVLFRIEDKSTCELIGFDWGYANFENDKWEELTVENRLARVVKWAEIPDPQLIL